MRMPFVAQIAVAGGLGFAAFGVASSPEAQATIASWQPASMSADCNIKGNISIRTDEKIYHMPWQEYYSETQVSPERGERWFCSEEEAKANGWRKALV